MNTSKKIIKYLAMAFALFLAITIVAGILQGMYAVYESFRPSNSQVTKSKISEINTTINDINIDLFYSSLTIKRGNKLTIETNNSKITTSEEGNKLNIKEEKHKWHKNNKYAMTITIPKNTYVNERAFKESPTHIYYFGLGTKSKYIYASSEDQATVIETDNFGNVYVQVDSVQYTSYDNWKVQLKLTGGLNESVSFDNYYKEVLVRKNFDIKISSCNSNGKVGIKITYN